MKANLIEPAVERSQSLILDHRADYEIIPISFQSGMIVAESTVANEGPKILSVLAPSDEPHRRETGKFLT
jgi:hypothetical protein